MKDTTAPFDFIEQSVKELDFPVEGNPLEKIEYCCRTSYKSHDRTKEGSAEKLFDIIYSNKHLSVLEHVYYILDLNHLYSADYITPNCYINTMEIYEHMMYHWHIKKFVTAELLGGMFAMNLRTLVELFKVCSEENVLIRLILLAAVPEAIFTKITGEEVTEDMRTTPLPDKTLIEHPEYHTFEIVTTRSIANEIVRHRQLSFTQESTRYVNYNKKPMLFINPSTDNVNEGCIVDFYEACSAAYDAYTRLLTCAVKPQFARDVLPLGLATTIVVTGLDYAWRDFLALRTNKSAHPMIREIAEKIEEAIGPVEEKEEVGAEDAV